jgi:hypothetical protein
MSLDHDFVLLDRVTDGEWALTKFIHHPRAIKVHDNFVRYILDTLNWIPTFNPATKLPCRGLNMWGPTLIEQDGAVVAERVFRAWARLLENSPVTLELTGGYSWRDGEPEESGKYERLQYSRDEIVSLMHTLADYSAKINASDRRLYMYHGGV